MKIYFQIFKFIPPLLRYAFFLFLILNEKISKFTPQKKLNLISHNFFFLLFSINPPTNFPLPFFFHQFTPFPLFFTSFSPHFPLFFPSIFPLSQGLGHSKDVEGILRLKKEIFENEKLTLDRVACSTIIDSLIEAGAVYGTIQLTKNNHYPPLGVDLIYNFFNS